MTPSGTFSAPTLANGNWKKHDYYDVTEGSFTAAMKENTMTYFIFTPARSGVYKFSATGSTAVVLGAYGGPAYPLTNSTVDASSGSFELEILRSCIGDGVTRDTTQYVIGIYAADKSAGTCTLTIQWLKEARLTSADLEPETVEAESKYLNQCTASGTLVDMDITDASVQVTLGSDGYYYFNGKPVYLRINSASQYLDASFVEIAGLTGFNVVYYDSNGNPVRKVQYKTLIDTYSTYCNSDGVIQLNEQLATAMKEIGEDMGWWDSTSQSYRFASVALVQENAWLFACGYYE